MKNKKPWLLWHEMSMELTYNNVSIRHCRILLLFLLLRTHGFPNSSPDESASVGTRTNRPLSPPLGKSQNPPIPPFSLSHHLPSPEFCADSQFPLFSSLFPPYSGNWSVKLVLWAGVDGYEVPAAPAANWGADIIRDWYTFTVCKWREMLLQ